MDIAAAIIDLLGRRAPTASVCPSEVARLLQPDDPAAWRAWMPDVRKAAGVLAHEGRVAITRKGERLDPDRLGKGPIRLRRGSAF